MSKTQIRLYGRQIESRNKDSKIRLGNERKLQLLGRPGGLVYLSTNHPKQNCTFESNCFWREEKKSNVHAVHVERYNMKALFDGFSAQTQFAI